MYGQPPHNGGSRRRSPSHNGVTRRRSPPHNGGSQRRSPPHNGGSRRRSPPQPREQHRPFENPDHIHSSQSQNYYFPSNPFFPQNPIFPNQNSNFGYSPFHQNPGFQFSSRGNYSDVVERVDRAVIKARRDLIEAGENVSAWKVSQAALVMLNADSWDSLGLRMQQVPSLFQLIVTDGKINAFIHCFVAVQRITTLYDLEVAILKNEGVEQFEELNLGPLVKHPLVIHYFSITPDVAEVFRITSVEIISFLAEYMDADKRRRVNIDEFLNFIAEKKSTGTTEKLGVRIQSLGMHIAFIKQARQSETTPVNKYLRTMTKESSKKIRNHALLSVQKQQFDEHCSTMCKNIKSFSSPEEELSGKHIRYIAGSEYENSDDDPDESAARSQSKFPVGNIKNSERPTTCPYPSASEEMMRLGLETEVEVSPHTARGSDKNSKDIGQSNRKRKHDGVQSSLSLPKKVPKRDMVQAKLFTSRKKKEKKNDKMWNQGCDVSNDFSHGDDSIKMFVNTWKEACRTNSVDEVFQRMLQFYKARKRVKVTRMFTSYPFCGLLHVAVTSIERGMWDSLYDKLHTIHQCGVTKGGSENRADSICVEVESAERGATNTSEKLLVCESGITIEDIHRKLSTYLVGDAAALSAASSYHEKFIFLLNKFCKLESWLAEQFSVKHFELLGYGNIWLFLEKNMHLFSDALQRFFTNDMHEKTLLEPSMLDCQFDLLLSQASQCLWENEEVDKRRISELLMRQFPLICLKVAGNDLMIDIEGSVKAKKGTMTLKSVVFSETLLKEIAVGKNNENMLEKADLENDVGHGDCIAMSKDAMKALVNAPMLIDLNLWLHWDMVFAPSLGSLVCWLLNEVKSEELLCLVTSCGKVLRVDHSATIDSFLNVLLQGNPFDTAAKLLSLLVLYGGEKSVPNSLLKCHARHAFEVLFKNHEDMKSHDIQGSLNHATFLLGQLIHDETTSSMSKKFLRSDGVARIVPLASRFILDCLGYLPVEFCHFAADILLTGLKPFVKDAPSAILDECERIDQRLMLHRAGMSLGIVEWVEDKHKLSAYSDTNLLMSSGSSCLKVTELDFSKGSTFTEEVSRKCPLSRNEISLSQDSMRINENRDVSCSAGVKSYVPSDNLADSAKKHSCELESSAAKVIESIQREEFGLQPDLSLVESAMLNKQHARLGRALHCLSQELYSQDSHFILELVQNADDNIYLENVEPTLTFILQDKGIIVLNNERGFSADNVRALCDVGNSTKKGRNAGYIGKKGIGFKSVFRVTDAPEIHSNGFHIKFDISNGQIGFVLPTVVPPCDIDSYTRLASLDSDCNRCNTCIVLPFRSSLLETSAVENIMSMFSDLHPSLLLFLHRLHCIKFRNMLSDSTVLMRKEVVGNGIVKVSLGAEKFTWFVASKELQVDTIRPDISNTEISMAFTLQETLDGRYNAHLNQQPVFAFLPLRKYGLKFILQGDFVLPSSREEVDGDSPWNQWLLSEFPDLFVSAERSFCDLLCFKDNPAKGVTAYMSFVPLVGEVHGFFSSLPRMILSRLRMSNCLIIESTEIEWVPPCKVLRNWTQEARNLLPDSLLRKHLGVGFLHKDIVLPDLLARALGIEEYGLKVLFQVINSICSSVDGLKSMSLGWLCAWLNSVYTVSLQGKSSAGFETETDLMKDLKKIPFIPLSDGKYGSLDEGAIWLHADLMGATTNDEYAPETFPRLYFMIRTVSPTLLSAAAALGTSCSDSSIVDNVTRMLYRVGVQRLSAHQIVKMHILPFICRDQVGQGPRELLTEYYAFLMFHLQSSCLDCQSEKDQIIREVRDNAFILTNYGCKRPIEFPIHFSKQFENPIDMSRLIQGLDLEWHEIGDIFLKHPINKLLSGSVLKWRKFFQEIGITDFVRVCQVEKSISDVCSVPVATSDEDLNSKGSIARDWVSDEFVDLLSRLSSAGDKEKCKYLLEVLDSLWDDYFADKVTGFYFSSTGKRQLFDSSFTKTLRDVQWLASSMDNELHCPRELFHDCDDARLIFGDNAPYAIPKVRSKKLLTALGLKTQVTVDDTLAILKVWRAKLPLSASLSQMSKFYTFIWSRMNTSERKVIEELRNEPFVFVPCKLVASHEDVVPGVLLSSKEVFWRDLTGSTDQVKMVCPEFDPHSLQHPFTKMLCSVYPSLRDFFVKECGVDEFPHFHGYLQILLQLSATALPSQAAKNVFQILLKWVDELNSGSLRSEDIGFLKQGLLTKDYLVLPTAEDKWVSLNPSFGLICWCDDDKLRKEFKDFDDIKFLYFGKLNDEEKEILKTKVSIFLRKLNIPSLSEVVTHEAIYYGPTDSSFVASVVNWTLPYAQRYIYNSHPDKYLLLSQSGFENLKCLQIAVVEKLFYRNVIKSSHIVSKKRFECSSLLEGKILYVTRESDSHSIFMELSRLFSSGTPDLHLANFLHMITTMAESGSTEEQTEFFIMNSQKMPKLPAGESVWSLENVPLSKDSEIGLMSSSRTIDEKTLVNFQKRSGISSNWPPSDWKTAPCSAAKSPAPSGIKKFAQAPTEITNVENADNDRASAAAVLGSHDGDHMYDVLVPGTVKMTFDPPHDLNYSSSDVAERDHLYVGTTDPHQALLTGRLGEFVAFKYFVGKHGEPFVKWVNETNETGLPYDLVVGDDEYIEVKATRATGKDWFHITSSEWQFAVEKGESFSIAQVVLSPDNTAMVTVYKNPVSLCQLGKLQLALTIHKS